ncbi:MAG: hypothetical protein ACE5E5_15165 [Phycisphaerae bacterium]
MFEVVNLFGDAAFSHSCADGILDLQIEEFHTYRFESLNGANYWVSVDGTVFIDRYQEGPIDGSFLQLSGWPSCGLKYLPVIHEWDMVRFGTIDYGERLVSADPPVGFLDADQYPTLDRFAVTFDAANYAYINEISVEVSGGIAPQILKTWRRENDEPDTFEIVLDRPIPAGQHTRFMLDDGAVVNIVDYSYILGDADGNGNIDLADLAALMNCFGATGLSGACLAVDIDGNDTIDLADYAAFQPLITDPT